MSFPDLVPRPSTDKGPGGIQDLFAEATGIPADGANTFMIPFIGLGVRPNEVDPDKMKIFMKPSVLAPGVTYVEFVALSADKTMLTLNFTQTAPGVGECELVVQIQHSITR
jgi:hypothetical protein